MEPHVKVVAEEQHIDYQFNGLEDDDSHEIEDEYDDADDDDEDDGHYGESYVGRDDGELSFDYGRNGHAQVNKSALRHSMEVNIYLCHAKKRFLSLYCHNFEAKSCHL